MIGIVIAGHGMFPDGCLSSLKMLTGYVEQVKSVCLSPSDSGDDFLLRLRGAVEEANTGDGVLIITDVKGGTPCKCAAVLVSDDVRLIAGANLPLMLEAVMGRDDASSVKEFASELLEVGKLGMIDFSAMLDKRRGK